jgi:hypothetical protein
MNEKTFEYVRAYIGILILTIWMCSGVSGEVQSLGASRQGDCVSLVQTCSNCTFSNLTTVQYPNKTISRIGVLMTKYGTNYNYSFCDTNSLGSYIASTCSDVDGIITCVSYNFEVTGNGSSNADGVIIMLFALIFIITAGLICWLAITSLGHLLSLDYDILDFAKSFGIYVVIIVLYYLEQFYVGNPVMDSWLLMLVSWGWIFFIMIPAVALILSLTVGTLNKKKMNIRLPQQNRRSVL